MPSASSASPSYRHRHDPCVPEMVVHWSDPEDFDPGFTIDAWAERQITSGEVPELMSATRLLAAPLLMSAPAHVQGNAIVGTHALRVWVNVAAQGSFDDAAARLTESSLADMWHAIHLASRPEAAHLRSAEQLLSFARIRRAMTA